jgi:hypothetical protein
MEAAHTDIMHGNLELIFREKREGRNMLCFLGRGIHECRRGKTGKKLKILCGKEKKRAFHAVFCMRGIFSTSIQTQALST